MLLHTYSQSPFTDNTAANWLTRMSKQDSLLLIADGVYLLQHSELFNAVVSTVTNLYVLQDDTQARNISVPSNVQSITMEQWVELSLSHDNVISW